MSEKPDDVRPIECTASTSWRMLGLTVLVVLMSAVLLNGSIKVLFRMHPGLDNRTYVAFQEQWHRLIALDEPVDTLILGDSSCRCGVDPEVLDRALATRSLNLCTTGDAAIINSVWQLETYLERHGTPKRVILVQVHDVWDRSIRLPLIARVPLPWKFWEHLPPSLSLTAKQLLHVLLALYVPVYSQDQTVTELFQYPWRAGDRRLRFSPRGFSPIREARPKSAKADAAAQIESSARGWHISDQNSRALSTLMELADELGFDLYLGNSPQLEGMLANPRFAAYYAKGQEVLRELASESPRTHIILSPPAEYAAQQMESSDHITAEVVPDFTYRLASAVTAHQ